VLVSQDKISTTLILLISVLYRIDQYMVRHNAPSLGTVL